MTDVALLEDETTVVVVSKDETAVVLETREHTVISVGEQGLPGPPGSNYIAGKPVTAASLTQGDHLEFSGEAWVNTHKTTLTDGGNF